MEMSIISIGVTYFFNVPQLRFTMRQCGCGGGSHGNMHEDE